MKRKDHEAPQGTCWPPKSLLKLMKSPAKRAGRAGDIFLIQSAMEVGDDSQEEDKEAKEKTAEENMLRTLCYVVEQQCLK